METLDNPSYFSLPTRCQNVRSFNSSTCNSLPRGANMGVSASSQPSSTRRNFRSLFRSLSGGPSSSSIRSQPLQVLKTPSVTSEISEVETDFSCTDMMYYNVPTPPKSRTFSECDELPPRYYHNIGSTSIGEERRRHSIGAFYREKKPVITTFHRLDVNANNTSKLPDLPMPVRRQSGERWLQQGARRKCTAKVMRSSPGHLQLHHQSQKVAGTVSSSLSTSEMDDILILSHQQSQVGNVWVKYITSCFEQICIARKRVPFRVQCVGLDELGSVLSLAQEERMVRVKLQIVVVCPLFLQRLTELPDPSSALTRLLQPDHVLAMLVGVNEEIITEEHRSALTSYSQWRRMIVRDNDSTFVSEFLSQAMMIIAHVAAEQQTARQEKAAFSVLPKKVKHGHNKIIVLLNEPLLQEDKIKVTVNKNGEILEVPSVKRRNQFTLHFAMPDACLVVSMLVTVRIEKNGEAIGSRQVKCESRMRELDQLLRSTDNPLDFMCQTLGIGMGDREQLDSFLVNAFQRNLPPQFNLFQIHPQDQNLVGYLRKNSSTEEYPTLLHFASRFGLDKLAMQLLECPGGDQACEIRNGADLNAVDMAEAAGHTKLAKTLRGYAEMNEFASMYCYLKMAADGKKTPTIPSLPLAASDNASDVYQLPRPSNETYQVPPAARPVPRPLPQPEDDDLVDQDGYLEMLPASCGSTASSKNSLQRNGRAALKNGISNESYNLQLGKDVLPPTTPSRRNNSNSPPLPESTRKNSKDHSPKREKLPLVIGVEDDLVEIINDFKNNVYSISEVEQLVENWKNRHDVQQSYKEKQILLNKMREQYERIQEKMKEDVKIAKPFERIKRLFKKRSKVTKESNATEERAPINFTLRPPDVNVRPPSSLSLLSVYSTSSSERMSTMSALSACSLGDSGTHSDSEDRKSMAPPLIAEEPELQARQVLQNYAVPPAPRPVMEARNKLKLNLAFADNSALTRPPIALPRPDIEDFDEVADDSADSDSNSNFTDSTITTSTTSHGTDKNKFLYENFRPPSPWSESNLHSYANLEISKSKQPPPVPPRVPSRNVE